MRKIMRKFVYILSFLVLLVFSGYAFFNYYSLLFAKDVEGTIENVERVTEVQTLVAPSQINPNQLYSFAIAIRKPNGEITTSSAVDRQWAVAQKGQCVIARLYPYPPWHLDKGGTFYNARLLKLSDCSPSTVK